VDPSLKVPVAVNCRLPPEFTEGFGGVIVMDFSVAAVTTILADPEIAPEVAVAAQLPGATAATRAVAETLHTELALEDHATELVTF
jgi:hypothetical protein